MEVGRGEGVEGGRFSDDRECAMGDVRASLPRTHFQHENTINPLCRVITEVPPVYHRSPVDVLADPQEAG